MNKDEAEKLIKDTIEYANKEIKKSKTIYLTSFLLFILLVSMYIIIFKYEIPVKFTNKIVEVKIPEDKGIDININLENYTNANSILVKTDENTYDLYINITQTLATKLFHDSDISNNLLRVSDSIIVDFNSSSVRGFIPNGNNSESIKHIYYIDNLSNKVMTMSDNELINYSNKILIWERK